MPGSQKAPDILVIMSDQHSRHYLGCYGNKIVRTPNLDRLAAGGMRFTDSYCPAPLCVPSRMGFMTGLTPSGNSVWTNGHILPSSIPTWAHVLGAAGYETSLIGRMHFVGPDQRHGFEKRPIGEYGARHPGVPEKGGPRWTKFPAATCRQFRPSVEIAGTGTTTYRWFDEQVTEKACEYLRGKAARSKRRPFAAVVGYLLPHCPFIAPKGLFEYYYDRVDIPRVEPEQSEMIKRFRSYRGILDPPFSKERIRVARAAYFALCEYADSLIGKVLDCLDRSGLARDTLVIYTSDHGEMAGEHGCWWKSTYYEGSAGVPLIARLPREIPSGAVSGHICNLTDLGPTFAELAGADSMPWAGGRSILPILRGGNPPSRPEETFSELVDYLWDPSYVPSRMIRSGGWKLWVIHESPDTRQVILFDLLNDPAERRDLSADPEFAGIREKLLARLYQDWDPEKARSESLKQRDWMKTISLWGKAVQPHCEDTMAVPPPEVEDDVQLL